MHRLLRRQLARHFGQRVPAGLDAFLADIDRAYCEADDDRIMLERSLDLTAQELMEINRSLRERAAEAEKQKNALVEMTRALTEQGTSLQPLARAVTEIGGSTLESSIASLWIYDAKSNSARCIDKWIRKTQTHTESPDLRLGEMPELMQALKDERTFTAPDAHNDPRTRGLSSNAGSSILCVPIRMGEDLRGLVCFEDTDTPRVWLDQALAFGTSVGKIVLVALERLLRESAEAERTHLEESLRQSKKLEAVGVLAGGIAHDFNNLLTPIVVCADLVNQELEEGSELHEMMQDIVSAAQTARELTTQLLAFGRKQVLQLRTVDFNEEVRSIGRLLARTIPENISVTFDLCPDACSVRLDPTQLQQVLLNLGINARDAMLPAGGRLVVSTRKENGNVVMRVTDSGHGMPAEVAAKIFEPFFTTKEKGRGTGLGLSMVYGIVTQHGGTIEVRSVEGMGTVFEIRLPLSKERDSAASSEVVRNAARGETILVVEDDELVRRSVRRSLEAAGYTVKAAAGGELALKQMDGKIDLVLSDVVMPGMDGPTLLGRIANEHPMTRMLLMSGHAQDIISDFDLNDRGVTLLRKPFTPQELLATVRRALS